VGISDTSRKVDRFRIKGIPARRNSSSGKRKGRDTQV
jgi:hypothetical protein